MKKIILKYNSKKIVILMIGNMILLCVFLYGLLNAKKLSLKELSNDVISRYRWVGELIHNNEILIFIVSLLFSFLFCIVLASLVYKLFKGKVVISRKGNKLYLDTKHTIDVENIQMVNIVTVNCNSWVYLYLKDVSSFLDFKENKFQKLIYKTIFYFNKNALTINLSLFEVNPMTLLLKLNI